MLEFLVANGHLESELWNHSAEKIELFFETARKRIDREWAIADLRMMEAVQAAAASCLNNEGAKLYREAVERKKQMANISSQEDSDEKPGLVQRLKSFGAKIVHGRERK